VVGRVMGQGAWNRVVENQPPSLRYECACNGRLTWRVVNIIKCVIKTEIYSANII
jgi:hypothetical protein